MKTINIASGFQVVVSCLVWMLGISTICAVAPVPVEMKRSIVLKRTASHHIDLPG